MLCPGGAAAKRERTIGESTGVGDADDVLGARLAQGEGASLERRSGRVNVVDEQTPRWRGRGRGYREATLLRALTATGPKLAPGAITAP